jgi:hypothetical protein
MGGEAVILYHARSLDKTVNNGTIPRDWRKAIVVPIYKRGDTSILFERGLGLKNNCVEF